MGRFATFAFGLISNAVFLGSFAYGIAFVGDLKSVFGFTIAPRTIDAGGSAAPMPEAIIVDALLVLPFAAHHSLAARQGWNQTDPRPLDGSRRIRV
jgi:hypothetical protein